MYFVISQDGDGGVSINRLTKEELVSRLNTEGYYSDSFRDEEPWETVHPSS